MSAIRSVARVLATSLVLACGDGDRRGLSIGPDPRWTTVIASDSQACALTRAGSAFCFSIADPEPRRIHGAPAFTAIALGTSECPRNVRRGCGNAADTHACGLTREGLAYCWGRNDRGQLGDGTNAHRPVPTPVTGGLRYRAITAGSAFTCAIAMDDIAYCWGSNDDGRLGIGGDDTSAHPIPRAMAHGVAAIVASSGFACALDRDGNAFCWGDDYRARLGSDFAATPGFAATPAPLNGVHRFVGVIAGRMHACGLTRAGAVLCWGDNADGELGIDPQTLPWRRDPGTVAIPPVAALASGNGGQTCGLTATGTAWCWGRYDLGSETGPRDPCGFEACAAPVPVPHRNDFVSLSTGAGFSCGIARSGNLSCWGAITLPAQRASPGNTRDRAHRARHTPSRATAIATAFPASRSRVRTIGRCVDQPTQTEDPMNRTIARTAAAAMFAAAVIATPTTAQLPGMAAPQRHLIRVGFGGGVSVPTSHAADALKNGINGQAYLLIDPGFGFPIRLNLGYQKFDFQDLVAVGNPLAVDGQSQIISGVAGLSINLIQLGPIRPYLTAGLGAFSVHDEFTAGGISESNSSTRFGIDGGGGIALRFGRLEAFIEGRVQNVYTDQGVIDARSIRAVPVTFGILF